MLSDNTKLLKDAISQLVIFSHKDTYIESGAGTSDQWLFDFRTIILQPDYIDTIAEEFFARYKNLYPFQVGGLEVAAIPIIAAIVMKSKQLGLPVNGFFIRKSRKKSGRLNMIEGTLNDKPIILVDDLINSGRTFKHQIEVIKSQPTFIENPILKIFTILRFKEMEQYTFLTEYGLEIESMFTLADFSNEVGKIPPLPGTIEVVPNRFKTLWYWKPNGLPAYEYVQSKSGITYDAGHVYTVSDLGTLFCLDGMTGKVIWSTLITNKKIPNRRQSSAILIMEDKLFFGASDGNLYCFDKNSGKRLWVSFAGDWIDANLCLGEKDLVFVVLQQGYFNKKSYLHALSTTTGKEIWSYPLGSTGQDSPSYSKKHKLVFCGGNGTLHAFDYKTGKIKWRYETEFVKICTPTINDSETLVVVAGENKDPTIPQSYLSIIDIETGKELRRFTDISYGCHGSPIAFNDRVVVGGLDKIVRCFSLLTGKLIWEITLGVRIFSSPRLFNNRIYIGANDAVLYEIDLDGNILSMTFVTERIVNQIAYCQDNNIIYLPTYANEIFALKPKD